MSSGQNSSPPQWMDNLLAWLCHPALLEEILGDLHEQYGKWTLRYGVKKARRLYLLHAIKFLRPYAIKKIRPKQPVNTTDMLKNYLKIAFRNLVRQKGFSLLNISGLSIGLACTFLLTLWIRDETSFDRFHENGDRLYRVMRHVFSGEEIHTSNQVTWNIAQTLRDEYPEVEDVTVVTNPVSLVLREGENTVSENGVYASPEFFHMFSWHLLQGDSKELLQDVKAIVISASLAQKYFGSDWRTLALGSTIQSDDADLGDFTVTGIFEDVPFHSSLQFDFVLPIEVFKNQNNWLTNWNNSGIFIYLRTLPGADAETLSNKIIDMQNEHIEDFRSDLFLQRYENQHLYSNFQNGEIVGGRIEYVRIFTIIAIIIVLIASINFMNLATARSLRRAREIGVRKAVGAKRGTLIAQFMGESFLLVFFAFLLALVLVTLALPFFNELTEKRVALEDLQGIMFLQFAGIGVLTALISGIYPALYLSSFDAVKILRGTFRLSGSSTFLRKGLVVFQFAISILLIAGTVIVYQQIDYIYTKNLGLDRENVIYLLVDGPMRDKFKTVKEELQQKPGIAQVSSGNSNPLDIGSNTHSVQWRGKAPNAQISMNIISVTYDFLEVMKMELADGRDFSPAFGTDTVNYIINQKAAEVMGFDQPLGEQLSFWENTGTIVGVVKDFHMSSFYSEIEPTIIQLRPWATGMIFLRTKPGETQAAVASLQEIYRSYDANSPFAYNFLDESFRRMYHSETVIGKLAGYFTAFAVFIACLGLFGLASYAAERRTKEIGIRKALGASLMHIVTLLNKDFILLVMIGFFIAIPIAWYFMDQWLHHFAYRIHIQVGVFLSAGLLALLIAILTVSWQSVKAALVNPIDSLKDE